MGCLYRLSFPNGKSYVGITGGSAKVRFEEHAAGARRGKSQTLCARAIRKYGQDSVKVETLVRFSDPEGLCLLEQLAIEKYNSLSPNGYNMTIGGEGVVGAAPEVNAKKSVSAKKRWEDPEYRAEMLGQLEAQKSSEVRLAAMRTTEYREKVSAASKARWNNPEFRAKLDDSERKARVSANISSGKIKQHFYTYAAVKVRVAYGECLQEKRECSLLT